MQKHVSLKRRTYVCRYFYVLLAPMLIYMLLFKVVPIWGLIMAFQNYSPIKGITGSPWVGLKHFVNIFRSMKFPLMLRNTLAINLLKLLFFFPAPIILSVMLNEMRSEKLKRLHQSIIYMPHFLS